MPGGTNKPLCLVRGIQIQAREAIWIFSSGEGRIRYGSGCKHKSVQLGSMLYICFFSWSTKLLKIYQSLLLVSCILEELEKYGISKTKSGITAVSRLMNMMPVCASVVYALIVPAVTSSATVTCSICQWQDSSLDIYVFISFFSHTYDRLQVYMGPFRLSANLQ